jgi:hypothetical protein
MSIFVFENNVNTTLAGSVSNSATSITLSSTENLPSSIPSGSVFVITLNDVATRQNFEIVYATAISGATLTVLRAQEGTAALAWLTGDFSYSPPTAGQQESFGQLAGNNTWTGSDTFSNPVTIPDGISPNHAASVEQLNNRKQIFTSSGSFPVPAGVTTMYLSGCAAGGGGGSGGAGSVGGSGAWASGGGGAGAGQPIQYAAFSVTAGGTISVAIGAAGTGGPGSGSGNGNNGTSGGNTVISGSGFNGGTPVTLIGGSGGGGGFAATSGIAVGAPPGSGFPAGGHGNDTTNNTPSGSGGTGASGPFGGGGGAARTSTSGGVAGGSAFGFGAGGGGGSGVYLAGGGNGGLGGNGVAGYMAFEW